MTFLINVLFYLACKKLQQFPDFMSLYAIKCHAGFPLLGLIMMDYGNKAS